MIGAVKTTGIYCKPSARRAGPSASMSISTRAARRRARRVIAPCLRCKPDEVGRDREAVAEAVKLIEQAEEAPTLGELAAGGRLCAAPFPAPVQARPRRVAGRICARAAKPRTEAALKANGRVTDAVYDAGYAGPSSFYSDAKERLGMTPSAWRDGGRGETIRWTHFDSPPADADRRDEKGICRLTFDDSEARSGGCSQTRRSSRTRAGSATWSKARWRRSSGHRPRSDLPIDVAGTAFQEAVWRELRKIPAGETRSYAQIAAAIGQPKAVRAVGTANGDNHVAVLIPCHRVIRSDGTLGGYAGGLDRKRKLLAAEGHRSAAGTAARRIGACRPLPLPLNNRSRRGGRNGGNEVEVAAEQSLWRRIVDFPLVAMVVAMILFIFVIADRRLLGSQDLMPPIRCGFSLQ